MAKIMVCDICYAKKKLTETRKYMSLKGHRDTRLDYCEECKKDIPSKTRDYVKFVYKTTIGTEVSDEFVDTMLKRRI